MNIRNKLLLILLAGMFLFSCANVSAFLDTKSFNKDVGKYGQIEIDDWLFLNKADYRLTGYDSSLINVYAEGEYTLHKKTHLFTGIFYKDILGNKGNLKNVNFYVWNEEFETRYNPIYENRNCYNDTNYTEDEVFYDMAINGTIERCDSVLISNESYIVDISGWVLYEKGMELDKGEGRWRMEAERPINQAVDFVLEGHNKEFTEWQWFNNSWGYKREIGNLTGNFSYFNVSYSDITSAQTDFDDLRFVNTAGTIEYNFTISDKNDSNWVSIRVHNQGDSAIYMYYGNADVTTTSSASDTYFNPVDEWYLDEQTGTNVTNAISDNHGVVNGSTINQAGKINKAYDFDGTGDKVNIPDYAVSNGDFSIGMWVYWDDIARASYANAGFLFLSQSVSVDALIQIYTSSSALQFRMRGDDKTGITSVATGTLLNDQWYFIVMTYNSTDDAMKIYVNATTPFTNTYGGGVFTTLNYTLFGSNVNHANPLDGKLDEPFIYNKALTSDQVYQLYTQNEPSYTLGAEELIPATPTITANATKPDVVNVATDYLVNLTIEDTDVGETLTGYVQFYVNGVATSTEQSQTVTNGTTTLIGTLSYGNFTGDDVLIAQVWAGDGTTTTTKVNLTSSTVTSPPLVTNLIEFPTDPATYALGIVYHFNATVTDNGVLEDISLEFDGINHTATNISADIFNISITNLAAGSYNYRWFANDSLGYINNTETGSYTIDKGISQTSLTFDVASPQTYGTAITPTCSVTVGDGPVVLEMDGNVITSGSPITLGVDTYSFNCSYAENTNYTGSQNLSDYTINKAIPEGSLTSNIGWTINETQEVTIGLSESNGGDDDVTYIIFRDGVPKGSGETWTPAYGSYSYLLNTTGGANWTANISMDTQTLTVNDNINPDIVIDFPVDGSSYSSIITELNYTASDTNLNSCWYSLNGGLANTTITCGDDVTGLNSGEGSSTWQVWANDSDNNINTTTTTFFVDITSPSVTNLIEFPTDPADYSLGGIYHFNATITDANTLDDIIFEFDGTNYTATNISADIFNVSFANLSVGTYNYRWFVNDTSGNINNTATGSYTINDIINPIVNLISPANNTFSGYSNQTFSANITDDVQVASLELYIWNESGSRINNDTGWCYQETANESTACGGLDSGTYVCSGDWAGSGCDDVYDSNWDTFGAYGGPIQTQLYINYTKPSNTLNLSLWQLKYQYGIINYTIPNSCWNQNPLQFNLRGFDYAYCYNGAAWQSYGDSIGGNLYEEAMNWKVEDSDVSLSGTINSTTWDYNFTQGETYIWNVKGTDTSGNTAFATNRTIIIDITSPSVTNLAEFPTDPATYALGTVYHFNATVTDANTLDDIILEFDGVNYTATNISANIFNVSIEDLQAGSYNYRWFANDTAGNINNTVTGSYTINKDVSQTSLTFDIPSPQTYETAITPTCSVIAGDGPAVLKQDGVTITSGVAITLGANTYLFNCSYAENANYTASQNVSSYTIDKAIPTASLTSDLGWYIDRGEEVIISSSNPQSNDGDVLYEVFRDGVSKGTGETWTPSAGTYTYFLNTTGGANWTANASMHTVDLIVDPSSPNITALTEYPSDPATYSQTAIYQFNATITDANTLDDIFLEFDGTNYSASNTSANIFYVDLNNLTAGNYNYRWFANDTFGNFNNSVTGDYTVNKATPSLTLTATTPITYGTITDFAGGGCPAQLSCSLDIANNVYAAGTKTGNYSTAGNANYTSAYANFTVTINKATLAGSITGTTPIIYLISADVTATETNNNDSDVTYILQRSNIIVSNPDTTTLGVGTYYYVYNSTGGQNYTSNDSIDTFTFTVNQATGEVYAYISHNRANYAGTNLTAKNEYLNGSLNVGLGDINMYLNNSLIASGTPPLYNITDFPLGSYYFNVTYDGNDNYTADEEHWSINVTVWFLANLTGVFNLNADTGTTAYDISGNINNGTIEGAAWGGDDIDITLIDSFHYSINTYNGVFILIDDALDKTFFSITFTYYEYADDFLGEIIIKILPGLLIMLVLIMIFRLFTSRGEDEVEEHIYEY